MCALAVSRRLLDHGQQHGLLGARGADVGGHDDLVRTVHGSLSGITLDDTFACGHLGAVGVGDIGLEFLALAVQSRGVGGQELARAGCFLAKGFDTGLAFGLAVRLLRCGVLALVQSHDLLGCLVQPSGTVQEFGVGAAALLAGVAG